MMLSSYDNTYTVFSVFYRYAIVTIPILSGFVAVGVNSFIINNSAADHYGGGAATIITSYYNHCKKYSSSLSLMSSMLETTKCHTHKSLLQSSKEQNQKKKQTTFTLRCSSNNNDEYQQQHNNNENNENSNENKNNEYKKYYRSISDVVGGLHGGKYQFDSNYNNDGVGDNNAVAFSGTGSAFLLDDEDYYSFNKEEEEEGEEEEEHVPNWVTHNMEPNFSNYKELIVPTNSNPMDGMIYFSSITIKNDERTWEKFYTKIITINDINSTNTTTTTTKIGNIVVTVQPKSGFLAPRGGTSNVCDINKPYSDKATIRIIQQNNNKNNSNNNQKQHVVVTTADNIKNNNNELWLVVGTEEEKWSYKLILE